MDYLYCIRMTCLRILLLLLILSFETLNIYGQCAVDGVLSILPATSTTTRIIELEVEGLQENDLSSDQELCAIFLEFEHGRIENVRISLTSPAGQTITLIGPGITGGNLSPLVRWNITMLQCALPASPDLGFDPVWNSAQTWPAFNEFTGLYHPHQGCLEDFNTGAANGTWTISIENLGNTTGMLTFFGLQFCNGNPSTCTSCSPYAGRLEVQPIEFCQGTDFGGNLQFELPPELGQSDSLLYFYQEPSGSTFFSGDLADISTLDAGETTICVLAAEASSLPQITSLTTEAELVVLADQGGLCYDFGDCATVNVIPFVDSELIERSICLGDTVMFNGQVFSASVDTVFVRGTTQDPCLLQQRLVVEVIEVTAEITGPATPLSCGEIGFLDATDSNSSAGPITDFLWTTTDGNLITDFGPIVQVDAAGTYFVETIRANCSAIDSFVVTADNIFSAEIIQLPVVCPDDTDLVIMARDTTTTEVLTIVEVFSFDGNQAVIDGDRATVSNTGDYLVSVQFGNCTINLTITVVDNVIIPDLPLTVSASNMIDCVVDTTFLMTSADESGLSYEWEDIFGFISSDSIIVVSEPGMYSVTVTDAAGCTQVGSTIVDSQIDFPENSTDQQSFDCSPPQQRRLRLNIDQAVDSVLWTGPNGFISTEMEPLYIEEGLYQVTMFGTNGCVATETVTVTAQLGIGIVPVFNLGLPWTVVECIEGESTVCFENVFATVDTSIQFLWTDQDGAVLSIDSCLTVSMAGTYTLSLENDTGCTGEASIDLTPIEIDIFTSGQSLGCGVESLMLDASASRFIALEDLLWTRNGLPIATGQTGLTVTESGTYVFSILDDFRNCIFSDSVVVDLVEPLVTELVLDIQDETCVSPGQLSITGISEFSGLIIDGDTVSLQAVYELPPDNYQLSAIDMNGCSIDTSILIEGAALVTVDLGPDQAVESGTTIELNADITGPVSSYDWSAIGDLACIDCPDNQLTTTIEDTVIVTVRSEDGCLAADTLLLSISNPVVTGSEESFYIPNVFYPGSGGNEVWILGLDTTQVQSFVIRVYDRWGNLVAESAESSPTTSTIDIWDGTKDGKPLNSGVYVYMAEFLYSNNIEAVVSGTITLLR